MASTTEDAKMANADDDSDVEMEGMDLDGDEEVVDDEESNEEDTADAADDTAAVASNEDGEALEAEDDEEVEEAHKEQQELMAAEAKKIAAPSAETKAANVGEQLEYLLNQSEVFAHFLAGTYDETMIRVVNGLP